MQQRLNPKPSSGWSLRGFLTHIPWSFLLIALLAVTTLNQIPLDGWVGYLVIGLGMLVIFIEFFKSGDLRAGVFLMDLVWSVAAIIVGTALMTILITETDQAPTFYHWYGCLILLADALLSPFNAFRTAQRNLEVGNL